MKYVKLSIELVVAELDSEAAIRMVNDAMDRIEERLTVYSSVIGTMDTVEPENVTEITRP
jgi:hypothetical protein